MVSSIFAKNRITYCRSGNILEVLGQIREFKNLARIIIIIALLKKNEICEF